LKSGIGIWNRKMISPVRALRLRVVQIVNMFDEDRESSVTSSLENPQNRLLS